MLSTKFTKFYRFFDEIFGPLLNATFTDLTKADCDLRNDHFKSLT